MAFKTLGFRSLAAVLAVWLLCLASVTGQSGNDIIYVYDELGRLVGVINPVGETAVYNYDAVGNVLSISRYNSSVVSIIEFTPGSGPVGASVTIFGTGFSTTPSQNTVSFNGVAASVTSATFSKIITSVPATATTGPISVTTPGGSAVTTNSFVVNESAAPTITSFTPTIGTPGTAVTVTGTNFETTGSRNRLKFNTTVAASGTATATTIDTNVPMATTSGRIKIETTAGSATSTADFFIPPSPYTPADVLVTDRMTLGESRTVAMTTANKIALVVFDAVEGQRATVKINSSTINSGTITIFNPKGTVLTWGSFNSNGTGWYLEPALLSTTGTYTIMIDPASTNTGTVNFTLHNASDQTGTIAIGDPTTPFTISIPGQNLSLKFNGTAGQRVSVGMSSVTIPGSVSNSAATSITTKGGQVVLAPHNFNESGGGTITATLPVTAEYKLIVDPKSANTGNVSITLSEELTATLTIGGAAPTFTFRHGQNGKFTFSGTAAQRVSVGLSGVTIAMGHCCDIGNVSLLNPDGSTLLAPLAFRTVGQGTASVVLPTSGTFSIAIDPFLAHQGDATLTLSEDHSGTIVINGPTVTKTFNPGQNALFTFDGVAGQRVSVGLSGVTIAMGHCCDIGSMSILNPDGSTLLAPLAFRTVGQGTASVVLPTSGTFSIAIDPYLAHQGNATLTLSEDHSGTIVINGPTVTKTFNPGQNALFTFDGVAGQRVSVGLSGVTIALGHCCDIGNVSILKPDGSTLLAPLAFRTVGQGTPTVILPVSGTYSILVDPFLGHSGNATVTLSEDLASAITINGADVPLALSRVGQNAILTFSGVAGQRVSVGMSGVTIALGDCCTVAEVSIYKPDGTVQLSPFSFSTSGNGTATTILPVTGNYSIIVNPLLAKAGNVTVTLSEELSGSITINGASVPLTIRPGQNALLTLDGSVGQRVSVGMSGVTVGAGSCCSVLTVGINKPDGTTLLSPINSSTSGEGSATQVLPVAGTYSIVINPLLALSGNLTVTLSEDLSTPITINGPTLPLTFRPGQNGLIAFDGVAGQRVSLGVSGVTVGAGSCCTVGNTAINKPDGTVLLSTINFTTGGGATVTAILPVSGTYTIPVNPLQAMSGNLILTLSEDVPGSVTINGGTLPLSLSRVGQNAYITFSGTSGTVVTVRITGNTIGTTVVKLLNPDGTTLTSSTSGSGAFNLAQKTLPVTGTYVITLDPNSILTGNITVAVTNP